MSFLSNLFKPKWQNSDAAVRKQALLALTPVNGRDTLRQIAQGDASPELRQLALKRLNELDLYEHAAGSDTDAEVRELGKKMVLQFLAGQHPSSPPLAERLQKVRATKDAQLREYVAKNADAAELRLEALNGIEKESVAADLAINDNDLVVRQAALARVTNKAALERISRVTKNKDKVISRTAKERYEKIIAEEEKPRKIAEQRRLICASIETLGRSGDWIREKNNFDQICTQWTVLEPLALADFAARFEAASAEFSTRYAAFVERNTERVSREQALVPIRADKERLLGEFDKLAEATNTLDAADETLITEKRAELDALQKQWNSVVTLPELEETEFSTRQRQISNTIRARLDKSAGAFKQTRTLLDLCASTEAEAAKTVAPKEKTLENLERRWNDTIKTTPATADMNARFQQALSQARDKRAAEEVAEEQARNTLADLMNQLQTALDDGHLSSALAVQKMTSEPIKVLEKTVAEGLDKLKAKLAAQTAQIHKLNNWRTWANTPHKEQLCVQVEALIGSEDSPREIANAISAAREAWQKLGPAERGTSAELWARFQAACDNAYAPCREFFAAESKQREEHLAIRTQFLDQLESFLEKLDWTTVDWKKIEPLPQQLLADWQQMGPTDRVHTNSLYKRFNSALRRVRDAISEEWGRNLPSKQSVVMRAQALVEATDVHAAVEQAKLLQAEWKSLGRIGQKQERELWTQFRAACDQVFTRRDQARVQREGAIEQGLSEKRELVQQAEALAALTGTELLQAQEALRDIQDKFRAAAPTRRDDDQKLERALSAAVKKSESALYQANRHDALSRVASLRPRAALCTRAEQAIANSSADTSPSQADWEATSSATDAQQNTRLDARWEKIGEIAQAKLSGDPSSWQTYLTSNQATKSILALQFEIFAGIESPPDIVQSRMEYQVNQLSQHMGQSKDKDRWTEFLRLESEWILCGTCGDELDNSLERRRAAALAALKKELSQELSNYA